MEQEYGISLSPDEEDKNIDQENVTKEKAKSKTNEEISNEKDENQDAITQVDNLLNKNDDTEQGNDNDTENNNDKSAVNSETLKNDVMDDEKPESHGDKKTKSEVKAEDNNIDENISNEGDTFTPQELLPVAIKLRAKGGKGFVSSSKSPEQLADKLFEAFC
ncbi:unnamed protein product [Colias eurytheme]|nr:unnamed protein product [Colias eurytheme]